MVEIGSVIRATVTRVEPFGVFLDFSGEPVLVLAPETAWRHRGDLRDLYRPGDQQDVLVLRFNYQDGIIVGSFRRLHPEQNPYRELSRLQPRTVLRGRITSLIGDAATVELPNGAWGHVARRHVAPDAGPGDFLDVVITALEVDEPRLQLELACPAVPAATGTSLPQPAGHTA